MQWRQWKEEEEEEEEEGGESWEEREDSAPPPSSSSSAARKIRLGLEGGREEGEEEKYLIQYGKRSANFSWVKDTARPEQDFACVQFAVANFRSFFFCCCCLTQIPKSLSFSPLPPPINQECPSM